MLCPCYLRVTQGLAVTELPACILEIPNLSSYPRPTESKAAFSQGSQVIHLHMKIQEAITRSFPSHLSFAEVESAKTKDILVEVSENQ